MSKLWAILRRDARLALSYPMTFWMQWVSIVISVTGFYYVSKLVAPTTALGSNGRISSYFAYVVVNMAFLTVLNGALGGFSRSIRSDQLMGTLEAIIATKTPLTTLAIGSSLWTLFVCVIQATLYVAIAAVLFRMDISHVNAALALIAALLSVACTAAFGILSAAVVVVTKQNPPTSLFVGGAASMLAGVLFPVSMLPPPLQWISWLLPLTHGLNAVRAAFQGSSRLDVTPDLAWLAVVAALVLPIALFAFKSAVKFAAREGTLAHY